ncbi:MAG: RND transporter [Gemmobacter sp.]
MRLFLSLVDGLPLWLFALAALSLGLAPFFPEPHIVEKLRMLFAGTLVRPIDVFDLFWHALPFGLLALKLARGHPRGKGR